MTTFDFTIKEAADKLTGFDMIEVKKRFNAAFHDLDPELKVTAIFYIHSRRQDDSFTHEEAMSTSYSEISDSFKPNDDATFPGAGTGPGSGA